MAHTSFYNDNAARDYPFLKGTSFITLSAVVSCGFMLGPGTGFVPGEHSVFLSKVIREAGYVWFYFTSDAPGLDGRYILFNFPEDATKYTSQFADVLSDHSVSDSISDSESSSESESVPDLFEDFDIPCDYADDFSGYMLIGDLADLLETLDDNATIEGEATVEPALLQSLVNTYARSVNLANADRTRYQPPVSCDDPDWYIPPQPLYVRMTCLSGKIVFEPGYNTLILQNNSSNSLTFSAATGAGAGEPCEQVPVYRGEVAPSDSLFFEGGPSCSEVVRSVGGVTGPIVPITGGNGVTVDFDPDNHTIVLDVDLQHLAACGTDLFTADMAVYDCFHEPIGIDDEPDVPHTLAFRMAAIQVAGVGQFYNHTALIDGPLSLPVMTCAGAGHFTSVNNASPTLATAAISVVGVGFVEYGNVGVGAITLPTMLLSGTNSAYTLFVDYHVLPGVDGETGSFFLENGVPVVFAESGDGGRSGAPAFGGSASVGYTSYSGGNARTGFFGVDADGTGGGSSAGPQGPGVSSTSVGGGLGFNDDYGDGGDGGSGLSAGQFGDNPGGGGGGGTTTGFGAEPGSAGQVRLSYGESLVETYGVPGWYAWAKPAGIAWVMIECWGGGGDGGNFVSLEGLSNSGGGGGAYSVNYVYFGPHAAAGVATSMPVVDGLGTFSSALTTPATPVEGALLTGYIDNFLTIAASSDMVIIGNGDGVAIKSADGFNWYVLDDGLHVDNEYTEGLGIGGKAVTAIDWVDNKFICGGPQSATSYSLSGNVWESLWPDQSNGLGSGFSSQGLGFAHGEISPGVHKYVAVIGVSGASIAVSDDGITWTSVPNGTVNGTNWNFGFVRTTDNRVINNFGYRPRAIAFGAGKFVVVGAAGCMAYSSDGVNWTAKTPGENNGLCFGDMYIITGGAGGGNDATHGQGDGAWDVIYANGKFVAVGANCRCSVSTNGVTWTKVPGSATTGLQFGTQMPPNGVTGWDDPTAITHGSTPDVYGNVRTATARGIAYGKGKFVVVGGYGYASYSSDGITWTALSRAPRQGIMFSEFGYSLHPNLPYVPAPSGPNPVCSAAAGRVISASGRTCWIENNWGHGVGIAYLKKQDSPEIGFFVAISRSTAGHISWSPDGITWTSAREE